MNNADFYEESRDRMNEPYISFHSEGEHCEPHFHMGVEIHYIYSGTFHAILDGKRYDIPAGHVQICSPYTIHSFNASEPCETAFFLMPLSCIPLLEQQLLGKMFSAFIIEDDASQTFQKLFDILKTIAPVNILQRIGICSQIIGLLIERCGLTERSSSTQSEFIQQVLTQLETEYFKPLRAADLAARFGYSESRFSHLFSQHVGYTIPTYLSMLRCRKAVRLLRDSDLSISDISMQVGFDSLRTFYRTFRAQYGTTPSAYRNCNCR